MRRRLEAYRYCLQYHLRHLRRVLGCARPEWVTSWSAQDYAVRSTKQEHAYFLGNDQRILEL
jgi:hypothetical protein